MSKWSLKFGQTPTLQSGLYHKWIVISQRRFITKGKDLVNPETTHVGIRIQYYADINI